MHITGDIHFPLTDKALLQTVGNTLPNNLLIISGIKAAIRFFMPDVYINFARP